MSYTLTDEEVRVLGALIEKARTTPAYYPMRLSNLATACNQKSNRDPVVEYDHATTEAALERLSDKGLVFRVYQHDVKGARYKHCVESELGLDDAQEAILCVLLLRGPQTIGELRGRTGRMYEFPTLNHVEQTLDTMGSLVVRLPPPPGSRAPLFAHTLGEREPTAAPATAPAAPRAPAPAAPHAPAPPPEPDTSALDELREANEALSTELVRLRSDHEALRREFESLRDQLM